MKKIIRLTESDLTRIVKRVIKERSLTISPYTVMAVGGKLKVTNNQTNESKTFKVEAKAYFVWVDVYVMDFILLNNKEHMKAKAGGEIHQIEVDKNTVKNLLQKNWNEKKIDFTTEKGQEIRFTKV